MHSLSSPYVALRDMDASPDIPVGEWICLEWLNDGAADEARLFWNNVERPSLHATPDLTSTLDPGTGSARSARLAGSATKSPPTDAAPSPRRIVTVNVTSSFG